MQEKKRKKRQETHLVSFGRNGFATTVWRGEKGIEGGGGGACVGGRSVGHMIDKIERQGEKKGIHLHK
jgi:hypothetical protein